MNRQEAINIVKKNWPDSSFTSLKEALEFLIPELMNTDDEKIKESIIKGIIHAAEEGCFCADNYSVKECVAWLEKQGEQKPQGKSALDAVKEVKVDNQNCVKPANKVEPKFHNGEWIIFNGLTLYVKEVVKGFYRTISIGGIPNSYDWDIDKVARLWSIADAKDGDVLISERGTLVIFNKINDKDTTTFNSYCHYDSCFHGTYSVAWKNERFNLATEDQRDFLFAKIKEASYEWDADNLELKKIEQKPVEPKFKVGDVITNDICTIQITSIDDKYYWYDNNTCGGDIESIDAQYHLVEQKPAIFIPKFRVGDIVKDPFNDVYHIVEIEDDSYRTDNGRFILFKNEDAYSLVKQKPVEWSEKDEIMIEDIINELYEKKVHGVLNEFIYNSMENWLKSLCPQNLPKWKKSLVYNGVSGNENLTFNENGVTYYLNIEDLYKLPREE